MKTIIVGFSKPRASFAPLAKLIQICEGSQFSHAYVEFHSSSLDRSLIYQATAAGVQFVGECVFDEHSIPVEEYSVTIPDSGNKTVLQWCVDQAGKPYGKLQLVGLGIVRLARLIGISMRNPFSNDGRAYICCELVAAVLQEAGLLSDIDLDKIGLVELRDLVQKRLTRKK